MQASERASDIAVVVTLEPLPEKVERRHHLALYQIAAEAAAHNQRLFTWLNRAELTLLLGATAAAAFENSFSSNLVQPIRVLAVALLAAALVIKFANKVRDVSAVWFDCRAVAEGAKSLGWLWMMRSRPFDGDEAHAVAALRRALAQLIRDHPKMEGELHRLHDNQVFIPEVMKRVRATPFAERGAIYRTGRVNDQLGWYLRRARKNGRFGGGWFVLALTLQFAALILAVTGLDLDRGADLLSFSAAVSAAVTALSLSERHENLKRQYGVAANGLLAVQESIGFAVDEKKFDQDVVRETESIISREHGAWVARSN